MQAAVLGIRHYKRVHAGVHKSATLNLLIDNTAVIALIIKGRAAWETISIDPSSKHLPSAARDSRAERQRHKDSGQVYPDGSESGGRGH